MLLQVLHCAKGISIVFSVFPFFAINTTASAPPQHCRCWLVAYYRINSRPVFGSILASNIKEKVKHYTNTHMHTDAVRHMHVHARTDRHRETHRHRHRCTHSQTNIQAGRQAGTQCMHWSFQQKRNQNWVCIVYAHPGIDFIIPGSILHMKPFVALFPPELCSTCYFCRGCCGGILNVDTSSVVVY